MPSSVVAAIQYDPKTTVLRVIYVSGSIYDYKKVPEEVYEAMRTARSKGIYLNKIIKVF
ncbi:MAG: KTSC domain-containing protein, partial [Chitinophagaceae bacterium]